MQVYHHIPFGKVIFYVFTILFHLYLLIRSAVGSQYLLAAILVIPVTAVSLALFKFLKRNVISVLLDGTLVEVVTALDKFDSDIRELKILGSEVLIQGRNFSVNLKKADSLIKALNEDTKKK